MIAEAGLSALWIAAALALLQLALGALALARGNDDIAPAIAPVAVVQAAAVAISFLCLVAVFMRSDMSVLLVASFAACLSLIQLVKRMLGIPLRTSDQLEFEADWTSADHLMYYNRSRAAPADPRRSAQRGPGAVRRHVAYRRWRHGL